MRVIAKLREDANVGLRTSLRSKVDLVEMPTQPPEAELIDRLRQAVRPKLSVRAAANAADISEGRWRQIIKGYNQLSKQTVVPSIAPADTLARMAHAVGATPEQLREVGRDDAADELERMMTVRERFQYQKAGGKLRAPMPPGLGAGLASLFPAEELPTESAIEDDESYVLEQVVAQTWREAHDLAAAVRALGDAPEELREVARRIIFTLSAFLIIRILGSGRAAEFEGWLRRIYTERERLFRDVTVGEPTFPWLTDEEIAAQQASAEQEENSNDVETAAQSATPETVDENQEAFDLAAREVKNNKKPE